MDNDRALSLLKEILLSEDRNQIKKLQQEVAALNLSLHDKEQLISALQPVLARLLTKKIRESKDEMAEALAPVMGTAIQKQISEAKETIIDALYPVIGQTIRKAVAEAMKNLARTVNQKIDRAFSFQLLSKKIKAKMSGVSTAEIVMNESLPFSVQDVFYIHKDSGVLLAQASSGSGQTRKELLSGMLTAIRNFSKSAFNQESGQNLHIIEYDDLHIHLEEGRYAYIAVVISGVAPDAFSLKLHELENRCHQEFSDHLRDFSGDIEPFHSAEKFMKETLSQFDQHPQMQPDSKPIGRYVFYTLILIAIFSTLWFTVIAKQFRSRPDRPTQANTRVKNTVELDDLKKLLNQSMEVSLPLDQVQFIVRDSILFMEGSIADEAVALNLGRAVATHTNYKLIVDRLTRKTDVQRYLASQHIYFEKGSASVTTANENIISELARYLKSKSFSKLILLGYSDPSGDEKTNQTISLQRAESVSRLLQLDGIDAQKIDSRGMGVANDTPGADEAINRRVDFSIE